MEITDAKKVLLNDDDLNTMERDQLIEAFKSQQNYIRSLEDKFDTYKQESEKKLKDLDESKTLEILKLKNLLLVKYMMREQEQASQLQELQNLVATSKSKQTYLDPAVNLAFIQMRKELDECRRQKEEAQDELNAWKFTADSHMGKRLVAKCRKLMQENEDLGKMISSGNVASLEADIAYHKRLLSEAYENEQSLYSFIGEMDNEMEGMQATIMQLYQKVGSRSSNSTERDKK
jgi:hypothetical protein